jgi:hypothetical protein
MEKLAKRKDAEGELDRLAKAAQASAPTQSYFACYAKVAATPEGVRLLAQTKP